MMSSYHYYQNPFHILFCFYFFIFYLSPNYIITSLYKLYRQWTHRKLSFIILIHPIILVISEELKHLNRKKNSKRILVVVVSQCQKGNGEFVLEKNQLSNSVFGKNLVCFFGSIKLWIRFSKTKALNAVCLCWYISMFSRASPRITYLTKQLTSDNPGREHEWITWQHAQWTCR
jgi:hypothetical protein